MSSQIVAIRLAKNTEKSRDHSVILDEDLDQPRSLALLPQKGSALTISVFKPSHSSSKTNFETFSIFFTHQTDVLDRNW